MSTFRSSIIFQLAVLCCLPLASVYRELLSVSHHNNFSGTSTVGTRDKIHDFGLASSQSFGFFDDIPSAQWNLLQEIYTENQNHPNPDSPLLFSEHDPVHGLGRWGNNGAAYYQQNYEPNFSCRFEKRVGQHMNGDGPKWVCDPHRIKKLAAERKAKNPDHPGCVVYSIGSNGDFNFEMGMQKEVGEGVCEYHIFDFGDYGSQMPKELKRATYHQWGLEKQAPNITSPAPGKQFYGLQDTIKLLNHEQLDVIDVFKIDCEGCEWKVYMDWLAEGIPRLQQIQVEVHGVPGYDTPRFFDNLEVAGYVRFHKEPNIQFNASCVEYSMLKLDTRFMNGKKFVVNGNTYTVVDGVLESSYWLL